MSSCESGDVFGTGADEDHGDGIYGGGINGMRTGAKNNACLLACCKGGGGCGVRCLIEEARKDVK